ncbi:hypothetical protein PoMZ_12867, partial [Pyricularia oryzae]
DGAIQEARRASAIRPCLAKQSFEINFSLRIIDLILILFVIPLPAFFAVSCPHAFFFVLSLSSRRTGHTPCNPQTLHVANVQITTGWHAICPLHCH